MESPTRNATLRSFFVGSFLLAAACGGNDGAEPEPEVENYTGPAEPESEVEDYTGPFEPKPEICAEPTEALVCGTVPAADCTPKFEGECDEDPAVGECVLAALENEDFAQFQVVDGASIDPVTYVLSPDGLNWVTTPRRGGASAYCGGAVYTVASASIEACEDDFACIRIAVELDAETIEDCGDTVSCE